MFTIHSCQMGGKSFPLTLKTTGTIWFTAVPPANPYFSITITLRPAFAAAIAAEQPAGPAPTTTKSPSNLRSRFLFALYLKLLLIPYPFISIFIFRFRQFLLPNQHEYVVGRMRRE